MSQFELEPWEVRADFARVWPTVVSGPVLWQGASTRMAVRFMDAGHRNFWALLRPLEEGTTNYIACYKYKNGVRPMVFHEDTGLDADLAVTSGANFPGRLFYVAGRPCVWNAERCGWLDSSWSISELITFRLPFFWGDTPPSESIFRWLNMESQNDASEVNFALRWLKHDVDHLNFVVHNSSQVAELIRVWRWVFQCLPFDLGTWCVLKMKDEESCYFRFRREEDRTFTDVFEARDQPTFLTRWNTFLFRHFYPLPPLDENLPLCVLDWFQLNIEQVRVLVIQPTHHERLEARFRLREWLQHNAPERMDLLEAEESP